MATYVPAKKNTAFITYVGLPSQANALTLQANPTLANGDVKVAIDDGAPANLATLPVVDGDFTKRVKVNLSAGEMNGDNITIIFSDAAGDEWCDIIVNIQTAANQIDDIPTVAAILAGIVEGTYDLKEVLRLILSFVAGKSTGGGTAAIVFRNTGDTKNRIIMTVDDQGNRSTVTLDES